MLNNITVKLHFQSLFPFKLNKNKIKNDRIFVKYFLFFLALSESSNRSDNFIKHNPGLFITKNQKNKTTVLRSPNRHKVAQFHVCRNIYNINSTFRFKFKITEVTTILIFKAIKNLCYNFDSSLIYSKKINLNIASYIRF